MNISVFPPDYFVTLCNMLHHLQHLKHSQQVQYFATFAIFATFWTLCNTLRPFVTNCDCLWSFATICDIICDPLRSFATFKTFLTYALEHLRFFTFVLPTSHFLFLLSLFCSPDFPFSLSPLSPFSLSLPSTPSLILSVSHTFLITIIILIVKCRP